MNVFITLFRNVRLFPRLATLTAAIYLLTGLAVGIAFGVKAHSTQYGAFVTILVLMGVVLIDFLAYFIIAANPVWFSRCQRAADSLYLIFSGDVTESYSYDRDPEFEENYCRDCGEQHDELAFCGEDVINSGEVQDIGPDDELSQTEDLRELDEKP